MKKMLGLILLVVGLVALAGAVYAYYQSDRAVEWMAAKKTKNYKEEQQVLKTAPWFVKQREQLQMFSLLGGAGGILLILFGITLLAKHGQSVAADKKRIKEADIQAGGDVLLVGLTPFAEKIIGGMGGIALGLGGFMFLIDPRRPVGQLVFGFAVLMGIVAFLIVRKIKSMRPVRFDTRGIQTATGKRYAWQDLQKHGKEQRHVRARRGGKTMQFDDQILEFSNGRVAFNHTTVTDVSACLDFCRKQGVPLN